MSELLLNFLGKRESDPDFQAFLHEMKGRFETRSTPFNPPQFWQGYFFDDQGFWFHIEPNYDFIFDVTFSVTGSKSGQIQPFQEVLPLDILSTDNRAEIRQKLGNPYRSVSKISASKNRKLHTDTYKIPPFQYSAKFREPDYGLVLFNVSVLGKP